MRGFLLGLSVSVAFIIGCLAGSGVQTARAQGVQRWEYHCFVERSPEALTTKANRIGMYGWEMVAAGADHPRWCFKRPRP